MTHSISVVEAERLIVGRLSGTASLDGFRAYVADLLAPPYGGLAYPILTDASELDVRSISAADVRKVVEFVGANRDRIGANRHAILVSQPLSFGLARMYELLAQDSDPQQTHVFDRREKALQWLVQGARESSRLGT